MILTILTGFPALTLGHNKNGPQTECSMGWYERVLQQNARNRSAPVDTDGSDLDDDSLYGMPVQTDLTTQQVSMQQETLIALQTDKNYLISEVEKAWEKVKNGCKLDSIQVKELKREVHELA